MDIFIGIVTLLFGVVLATMGLRVWFWMLPILGFLVGFSLGTIIVFQLAGDGVLQKVLSWVVGLIVGVAFAAVSWFWWYIGVIIAAATSGGLLTSALVASFGVDTGWVLFIVAVVGAVLVASVALALRLPIYLVVVNTAIAGGMAVVSGLLMVFQSIEPDELGNGHAVAVVNDSLFWWLLWIVVAVAGMLIQLRYSAVIALPQERFVPTTRAVQQR